MAVYLRTNVVRPFKVALGGLADVKAWQYILASGEAKASHYMLLQRRALVNKTLSTHLWVLTSVQLVAKLKL